MSGQVFWSPTDPTLVYNPWDVVKLVASQLNPSDASALASTNIGGNSLIPTFPISGTLIHLPGITEVTCSKDIRTTDLVSPGRDNAPVYYLGANPATGTLTTTVWMPDQWDQLQRIGDAIQLTPNKGQPLISYRPQHPIFAMRRINAIIFTKMDGPMVGKFAGGSMAIQWAWKEYAPPPKITPPAPATIAQQPNVITGTGGATSLATGLQGAASQVVNNQPWTQQANP